MKCPKSPFGDTKVIESRLVADGQAIRRRRQCLDNPSHRFTTYERIERPHLIVIKRSGERQLFDRSKLMTGLQRATQKTKIRPEQLDDILVSIEEQLYEIGDGEVSSEQVGDIVLDHLAHISDVAYIRFASVYKSFKGIESFEAELRKIKNHLEKDESK